MKTLLLIICNLYAAFIWAQTPDFKQYGWSTTNGGTTGGTGGAEVVVTTMADLNAKAKSSGKLIIYVSGTLTGRLSITSSDKTIFGLPGAKIQGSIGISGANNIIVRNLIVRGDKCSTYDECKNGDDAVGVSSGSKNIWLDHLDIADGQDGNCDVNRSSDFVTISWSKFSYTYAKQHRFSNLIGSSDAATYDRGFLSVTYHHCWWGDMVNERQPRVRFGKVHVANNLYTSTNSNYCARAGFESNMLVEGNVFKTTANSVDVEATATAVIARNNCGGTGANKTHNAGSAFKPPYTMPIEACGASLEAEIREWTGATLCDPRKPCGTVGVNTAPTVSITSPVTNSNYTSPATVLVKAKALDSDGTITKVEFFQGTTKIGEDLTGVSGEYTFSWTNVAAGSYTITAKATDDDGATKVSTGIVVNVKAPVLVAPKVALTSPLTGASDKSPATFAFAATASDADGTITKLEFWGRRGGTTTNVLLGSDATAPYTFNWQNITAEGDYFVFAKAIDDDGLETNTAVITIKVLPKNVAPVVSITSPITNASYVAPADINLTVTATDSDGKITKVEYFNGTTKLGEDLVTPYSYSIIDLPVGIYTLTAKATDNDGAISTSTGIIVKVTAPVLVPPVVTLNTPTVSQVFTTPASVSFTATATDKDGTISKVEFWGRKSGTSSVVLLGSDATSPYSFNWATSDIGGYLVYAKAYDNDGQMTNSTVVNITIKAPNVLPTVQFISPLGSEVINFGENVDLEIFADDVDGTISKVEIYNGVNKVTTLLADPYIYNWASLAPGTYTVTAKAYDNEGGSKTTSVTFVVKALITSVENDINIDSQLIVGPNPFFELLNVSSDIGTDIEISNLNGKIVYSGIVENETIDTSDWQSGLYFVKIKSNNKVLKFIK